MINRYHRRSIRLKDYDYTRNGAYFVTICAYQRLCLWGDVADGAMMANKWGMVVQEEWERTGIVRVNVELDAFVVMPNHIHGIIVIIDAPVGATRRVAPTSPTLQSGSLGAIIGQFKSIVTKRIRRLPNPPEHPIWQRNYYEHIIRNEESLNQIRAYIEANPARWEEDSLYSEGRLSDS